jgi:arylsulfatase
MNIELYDLKSDPAESNDISIENPDIVAKIEAIMLAEHTPAEIQRFKIKQLGDK